MLCKSDKPSIIIIINNIRHVTLKSVSPDLAVRREQHGGFNLGFNCLE